MATPTVAHWEAVLGVVRYLVRTANYDLTFGGSSETQETWTTTRYVFLMFGGAVSLSSRLQLTVAVSTVEAEYLSMGQAVKETLWF
jgi:hypothetical protein